MTIITSRILHHGISKLPARMEIVKIVKIDFTPKLHLIGGYEIHRPNVFTENSRCNKKNVHNHVLIGI
jgi:hypothetical protein